MLRAALVVSILLASLTLLSRGLLRTSTESGVDSPRLIEMHADEVNKIDDAAADERSPDGGKIALVTNIEELAAAADARPDTRALTQRWGGRAFLRRRGQTTREADTVQDLAKPRDTPAPRILPDRNRLEVLKSFRQLPDRIDNLDLVDPADVSRIQVRTQPPPLAESRPANQSPDVDLPKQPERSDASTPDTTEESAVSAYYDADWYKPTELNKNMLARRNRIRQCLDHYYRRPLNSQEHSPWSLMHTMIAWGSDSYIRAGGPRGRSVGTVHWLAQNGLSDGVRLLYVKNGQLQARTGPGLQGHDGQLLAMFAQTRVRADYPIRVDNYDFDVRDLIDLEKSTCRGGMELTFKLIGLAHYLHPDDSWQATGDTNWDIPKLIRAEIAAPINGVTCGGTHRLMGLSYAVRMRRLYGLPVDGQWARADKHTSNYVNLAFRLQNNDGTFSTNFFRGKENRNDMERQLKTTGHLLEWVVFAVPHERLRDRRITRSVDRLTNMLMENRYYDWPKGPIGHAIRALSLYNERVFNIPPGTRRESQTADRRAQSVRK